MTKVSIGKALDWMMHGYPVRMSEWPTDEYLRYSELHEAFVLHSGGEASNLGELIIPGDIFTDQDWILGSWHPGGKDPIWNNVEVVEGHNERS